jgi:5-methylthioadenosine/S-adenosylhomocysteine deaminase
MSVGASLQTTAIANVTLLTLDQSHRVIHDGTIIIEGDRIKALGKHSELKGELENCGEIIDGRGCVALPGFVNCHTHTFQSLLRGLSIGKSLIEFLAELIYPVNKVISPEDMKIGASISILEAIKSGTTCLVDNNSGDTSREGSEAIAEAMDSLGIRGVLARGIRLRTRRASMWGVPDHVFPFDLAEEIEITEELISAWNGKGDGRLHVCPAPLTLFLVEREDLLAAKALADQYQVPMHVHVAETQSEVEATLEDHGLREVEYLASLGLLDDRCHIVHGVWLNEHELDLIAEHRAHVIHNPTCNMSLGSGVAPIPEMLRRGINVALGTDGVGNFNHDMFSVVRTTPLLHSVHLLTPDVLSAEQVLEMATRGGARALGLEDEIGSLEVGKKADIVMIDLDKPHLIPYYDVSTAIVFGAIASDVAYVFINGNMVVQRGLFLPGDEKELLEKARSTAQDLIQRAGLDTANS